MGGSPLAVDIAIGDDVRSGEASGPPRASHLHLELPGLSSPDQVVVKFNGQPLKDGTLLKGWLDLAVPPDCVKQGENRVEISRRPAARDDAGKRIDGLPCRDLAVHVEYGAKGR